MQIDEPQGKTRVWRREEGTRFMSMDEMHWATAHRDFHGGSGRGVRDKRAPEAVAKPPTDIPVRCFVLRRQLWQEDPGGTGRRCTTEMNLEHVLLSAGADTGQRGRIL